MGIVDTNNRPINRINQQGWELPDEPLGWLRPVSEESLRTVLLADENSEDGRSQFFWLRLQSGDLILGCFPQGETYFETENDH